MKTARSIAPPSSTRSTQTHTPNTEEIQRYMPLVHQTVARFLRKLPPNVLRDDLIAAGTFGLVDSLRKNGSDQGGSFEWYARIRIRGAILDELRAQDWLTRRARGLATAQAASMPDDSPTFRATVVGFDDLPGRLGSCSLADEVTQSPLEQVEQQLDKEGLAEAISELPDRERYIVYAHYFEGAQFKAIATTLGVSEPRVSQLHARAVQLLRTKLAGQEESAA